MAAGVLCSVDSHPIASFKREEGLDRESSGTGMKGQIGGWDQEGKVKGNCLKQEDLVRKFSPFPRLKTPTNSKHNPDGLKGGSVEVWG